MATKYYTLTVRDAKGQPFGIHFGSYDKAEVRQEREDMIDSGYEAGNLMIVTSADSQTAIDVAVCFLNAEYAS